ncbi:hypothetical protein DACRYDRAFT_43255, partial [Dacryopinax primogenitus]
DVAKASPVPVMIYNCTTPSNPLAAAGIDLDSTTILELAQSCPNICGAKLTCENMGKLYRISIIISQPAFVAQ